MARQVEKVGGFAIRRESDAWLRKRGKVAVGQAAVTGAGKVGRRTCDAQGQPHLTLQPT